MVDDWTPRPAADVGPRSSGRLRAAEVRRRMIAQGLRVVCERGLTVGLDDIRIEDLIAAAGVPRSSVWRLWATKAHYVTDLLVAAADPDAPDLFHAPLDPATVGGTHALLASFEDHLSTPAERRAALTEVTRTIARRHYEMVAGSPLWRTYLALLATLPAMTDPTTREQLVPQLYAAERESFLADAAAFYAEVLPRLGVRLRDPSYTWLHLAVSTAALVEGLALRAALPEPAGGDERRGAAAERDAGSGAERRLTPGRPTLPDLLDGALAGPGEGAWTTVALGVLGLVDAFTEPDPTRGSPDAHPIEGHGAAPSG
jgi:AcrR family transcriptional regulator